MAIKVYALDGGGPKDSKNTLNSILTKRGENVFWQIGTDMYCQYTKPLKNLSMYQSKYSTYWE